MSSGTFLYPNVTSLPGQSGISQSDRLPKSKEGVPGEFGKVFEKALNKTPEKPDLDQVQQPLKFSAHASQRLKDRKITLDAATMSRVSEAVTRAEAKGLDDTLVLTNDAALIVSARNRTVITAMDRASLAGNVFTNIDGAVIV
ncbi:MAG TPA: flagellar protein [Bdellovibrionales bacterium]|nr:flagellar protein [Bdellovibrionales bacterium]HCM39613.1 flagellar protein [Bdellovibrionales bacterium]